MSIRHLYLLLLFSLFGASAPLAEETLDPIDTLIEQAELSNLDEAELEKLRSLVLVLLQGSEQTARMAQLAQRYFTAKGYKLLYVQLASVEGKYWLIVTDTYRKSATSDLPIMFPRLTFENGYYFCKTGIVGGITELIDMDSKSHSFMFANWRDLR